MQQHPLIAGFYISRGTQTLRRFSQNLKRNLFDNNYISCTWPLSDFIKVFEIMYDLDDGEGNLGLTALMRAVAANNEEGLLVVTELIALGHVRSGLFLKDNKGNAMVCDFVSEKSCLYTNRENCIRLGSIMQK